jgi:hypothetical protein
MARRQEPERNRKIEEDNNVFPSSLNEEGLEKSM